jgi:putative transposase
MTGDAMTGDAYGAGSPYGAPPCGAVRRDNRQSARFTRCGRRSILEDGRLRLPKIGDMRVTWTRDLPCEPSSVTLVKDRSGPTSATPG